jgi:hypothetical protein
LPQGLFLSRYCKHTRAFADTGFHDPSSHPSAPTDDDHVLISQ